MGLINRCVGCITFLTGLVLTIWVLANDVSIVGIIDEFLLVATIPMMYVGLRMMASGKPMQIGTKTKR